MVTTWKLWFLISLFVGTFKEIMSLILDNHSEAKYYSTDGLYTGTCDSTKYESFFLYTNGYFVEVTPETYIISIGSTNDECVIGIISSSDYSLLLGDVFLKNFYSIWDNDNA